MTRLLIVLVAVAVLFASCVALRSDEDDEPREPAAPAVAPLTVTDVLSPTDVRLSNGQLIHIPGITRSSQVTTCREAAVLGYARDALLARVVEPYRQRGTSLDGPLEVPAGATQASLWTEFGDYGSIYSRDTPRVLAEQCPESLTPGGS